MTNKNFWTPNTEWKKTIIKVSEQNLVWVFATPPLVGPPPGHHPLQSPPPLPQFLLLLHLCFPLQSELLQTAQTNKNIEEIATLFLIQCFLRIKILGKLINQYKKKQVLVFFSLVFQFVRRNSCRSYLLAVNADNMRAKQHRGRKQEETSEGKSSGWDASHRHGNGEQQARSQESEQLNIPK